MKNTWLLSKVLIKNNYNISLKSKEGRKGLLIALVLVVCMAPIMIQLYISYAFALELGMQENAIRIGLFISCIFCTFTIFFAYPSLFYFANDTRILLPLPLSSWQIIFGKTIMLYVSQVALDVILLVPLWVAWAIYVPFNLIQWIFLLLASFLVVLTPLMLIGIFTLLIMALMPFFRDKDRFNLVTGILSVVLVLVISYFSGFFSGSAAASGENLLEPLLQGATISTMPFFQIPFLTDAIINQNWIAFAISLLIVAVCAILYAFTADKLYISTVSRMDNSQKRRKNKENSHSPFMAYLGVEVKKLVRSPAYLTNLVIAPIILPAMAVIFLGFIYRSDFQEVYQLVLDHISDMLGLFLIAGIVLGLFQGGVNGCSATCISREGQNLFFMKVIPLDLFGQLLAKLLVGILLSLVSSLLFLIPFIFVPVKISWILNFLLGLSVSIVLLNLIGLYVDLYHPKLIWDDETTAIKNNYNVLIETFVSFLIVALLAVVFFLLKPDSFFAFGLISEGILTALSLILLAFLPRFARRCLYR